MIEIPDSAVEAAARALDAYQQSCDLHQIKAEDYQQGAIRAVAQATLNEMLGEPVAYVEIAQFALAPPVEWDVWRLPAHPSDVPLYAIKQGASRENA